MLLELGDYVDGVFDFPFDDGLHGDLLGEYDSSYSNSRSMYDYNSPPPRSRRTRRSRSKLKVHIMSYSRRSGVDTGDLPVLFRMECHKLQAPPRALCRHFTGIDPEIQDAFFSNPKHRRLLERALMRIEM